MSLYCRDNNMSGRGRGWGSTPGSSTMNAPIPMPFGRGRGRGSAATQAPQKMLPAKAPAPVTDVERYKKLANAAENSSEEESDDELLVEASSVGEKVFKAYHEASSGDGGEVLNASVQRTRDSIIENTKKGSLVCIICLEQIEVHQAVWQCSKFCYKVFHLICIQSWARSAPAKPSLLSPEAFPNRTEKPPWYCPNCRGAYPHEEVPQKYFCFCSKEQDPPVDRWLVPHSCGQICSKPLIPACGHECKLLCHPGPCPPCPQTVIVKCFCGKKSSTQRCGRHAFSCNAPCLRTLNCGIHKCGSACHAGDCMPCQRVTTLKCRCGLTTEERACGDRDFQCAQVCNRPLGCGKHKCGEVCHTGVCPPCPLSGIRTCPCGKEEYRLPCDQATPTCGQTCGKMLPCGRHKCPNRCHTGPCETCRQPTNKKCRCGSDVKMLPCSKEFTCERKCTNERNCGRHACRRRCCPGDCPPCDEQCNKKLNCQNHKCPATCHAGPCFPCPATVRIACACDATAVTVPCGRERVTPVPKCRKHCSEPPYCHHPSRKPHLCHFPPCPKCVFTCDLPLPGCPHVCPLPCHDPIPPELPPEKKKRKKQAPSEVSKPSSEPEPNGPPVPAPLPSLPPSPPRDPCPSCAIPLPRQCLGLHETRVQVCSALPFDCGRPCDAPLLCTNHRCPLSCHRREGAPPSTYAAGDSFPFRLPPPVPCQQCGFRCDKPRIPFCKHPCTLPCHPGDCPPCTKPIKLKCHCATSMVSVPCYLTHETDPVKIEPLRSCNNFCHRKLPSCSHLCSQVCHSGPCPEKELCKKKVTVRCSCRRLKKDWVCADAQAEQKRRKADGRFGPNTKDDDLLLLLPCDDVCNVLLKERLAKEAAAREEAEARRQEEEAHAAEIEARRGQGKRRRRRREDEEEEQPQGFLNKYGGIAKVFGAVGVLVMLFAIVFKSLSTNSVT
mmetsp:Transcript_32563/g.52758  ORF Transcript_32563/g.52758 Transcript_32563/m.52758 type:complete len:944 (-) Transcript_32563:401-3232(-)